MTPLYGRPDFARFAALQLAAQRRPPDTVIFFQNGEFDDYRWAIADLTLPYEHEWHHVRSRLPQELWYATPLKLLLEAGCDTFFWCDHDDIYFSNHISESVRLIEDTAADLIIDDYSGLLQVTGNSYRHMVIRFTAHAPGGASSSMAFNRPFAEKLHQDLLANLETKQYRFADEVLAYVTMPKFVVHRTERKRSVCYVCHAGTYSSSHWLKSLDSGC